MSTLEQAIALAATAHAGQVDKAGAPYILHPLRVMLSVSSLEAKITAVLHDVVEDCEISLEQLRQAGFSDEILAAIDSVTKRSGESYENFIQRAAANPIGRQVKMADLQDNSDLSRIANPTERDFERLAKYQRAIEWLQRE